MVKRWDYFTNNEKTLTITVLFVFLICFIDATYLYIIGDSIAFFGVSIIAGIILISLWIYLAIKIPKRIDNAFRAGDKQ